MLCSSPRYLLYTSSGGGHRSGGRYHPHGGTPSSSASAGGLYFNQGGKSTPYNATLWLKRLVRDLSRKRREEEEVEEEVVEEQAESAEEEVEVEPDQDQNKNQDQDQNFDQNQEHGQSKRDVSLNMDLLDIVGVDAPNPQHHQQKRSRTKRQSPGRSTLCQTTSQFITPQAALNSRGNWMFVVNEQNTARQMVKAELCA